MVITELSGLQAASTALANLTGEIEAARAAEQKAVDAAQNDASRSGQWKAEQIAQIRRGTRVPALLAELKTRYAEFQETRPIWTSPINVLSKQSVLPAPPDTTTSGRALWESQEATVRANLRAELAAMPLGVANLWATEAALNRQWGRVYCASLVLKKLPFFLDSLPIGPLVEAEEAFYRGDVALRTGEIAANELAGNRDATARIALGLMLQQHEEKVKARMSRIKLNADEREQASTTKAEDQEDEVLAMLEALPEMTVNLPNRQTGAGFKPGAPVRA